MINILVLYFDFVSSNLINFLVSSKYSFFVNQILSLDILNFSNIKFDLALLFLPKQSNIDFVPVLMALLICAKPVIVLDPSQNNKNKAISRDSGAVAYFSYPVSIDLIDKAILKILSSFETLFYADLKINTKLCTAYRNNINLKLRKKEFDILTLFLRFPNKVLTKEFIYKALWDINYIAKTNTLEVHMSSLRRKINHGFDLSYIKTVNCIGYKLI
ncbi:hypothetical protein CL656_05820 [bacterium]|nr:hypothetical protein [bacterium]